jgi:hypothetical protein
MGGRRCSDNLICKAHQGVNDGEAQLHPLPPLPRLWPQLILPPSPLPAHISVCAMAGLCVCTGLHVIEQARSWGHEQRLTRSGHCHMSLHACNTAALVLHEQVPLM